MCKQNLCVFEVAFPEFDDPLFINVEPLQKFRIDIVLPRADEGEHFDRFAFSFYLNPRDRAKMKFVADQLGRALSNQNIDRVNTRERFQSGSEIHRVADHGWIEPFVWFVGTDIPDNRVAMINANAEREWINSLRSPRRIQLG